MQEPFASKNATWKLSAHLRGVLSKRPNRDSQIPEHHAASRDKQHKRPANSAKPLRGESIKPLCGLSASHVLDSSCASAPASCSMVSSTSAAPSKVSYSSDLLGCLKMAQSAFPVLAGLEWRPVFETHPFCTPPPLRLQLPMPSWRNAAASKRDSAESPTRKLLSPRQRLCAWPSVARGPPETSGGQSSVNR